MRVPLSISYNFVKREQNCTKRSHKYKEKAEEVLHV